MIFKATRLIQQAMEKEDMHSRIEEGDKSSRVLAGFGVKNGPNVRVQFISTDDDNDVAIRLFGLVSEVADDKFASVTAACNTCNNKYRYVKFLIDDDRDVNVEYDLPVRTSNDSVGREAVEIFMRFMQIVDECYPEFMKALWS